MLIMKRTLLAAAWSVAAVVALAGCSVPDSTGTATVQPTRQVTPTPTAKRMSIDEAGQYFLGTVCPVNKDSKILNDGYAAQNLEAILAATDPLLTSTQDAARRLSDPTVVWPDVIDEKDVDALRDYYFAALPAINSIKESTTLEQANAVTFPEDDGSGASAQKMRLHLNLSADTTQGC